MKIAIIGSTGSVGTQTLGVIRKQRDLSVSALVAYSNQAVLSRQVEEFKPQYAALISKEGEDCIKRALDTCELAVVSSSGITALKGILYAIQRNIPVALANKESLVCGGRLINEALKRYGGSLRPVDSEHSAIWQCIGQREEQVRSIIITASGGAFRGLTKEDIKSRKAVDALKHPTWNMGRKITIDSATLMNKTFELIEAYFLFGRKPVVTVHPQSIVHSMVEFNDGAILAQLARPDMALPIAYALTYPERRTDVVESMDFSKLLELSFSPVDREVFPCITFADRILDGNIELAAVMNGADDVCVQAYLDDIIGFYELYDIISEVLDVAEKQPEISGLFEHGTKGVFMRDAFGREYAQRLVSQMCNKKGF